MENWSISNSAISDKINKLRTQDFEVSDKLCLLAWKIRNPIENLTWNRPKGIINCIDYEKT